MGAELSFEAKAQFNVVTGGTSCSSLSTNETEETEESKRINDSNVFVGRSKIVNPYTSLPVGLGIFARRDLPPHFDFVLYSGVLIDRLTATGKTPTYLVAFEFGHGLKLNGDNIDGDLGMYANGTHPAMPHIVANATFHYASKKATTGLAARGSSKTRMHSSFYSEGDRGCIPLRTLQGIK